MSNHPNRARGNPARNPAPAEVIALREALQAARSIGITAAQQYCAERMFTTLRVWQGWERGERRMHPLFWWAAQLRIAP